MIFRNEYWFMSNMFECPFTYNGLTFRNVEAAFHAQKSTTHEKQFCNIDGFTAKKLGRRVPLRADWSAVRVSIMTEIVRQKFRQNPALQVLLLNTGDLPLVEENTWNDTFWGTCNNRGENHLGKILMIVRSELRR